MYSPLDCSFFISLSLNKTFTGLGGWLIKTITPFSSSFILLKIPSSLFLDLEVRVVSKSLLVIDEFILTKTGSFSFHSPLDNTKCI